MKNNKIIIGLIMVAIIAGGAGFFGGMKYQQSKLSDTRMGNFGGAGPKNGKVLVGTGAGNGGNFRPVSGDIISVDEKSITIKMADGSTKIVLFSDSMALSKSAEANKSDLIIGDKVTAFGTQNSDGSVTAQNIQLNP